MSKYTDLIVISFAMLVSIFLVIYFAISKPYDVLIGMIIGFLVSFISKWLD